jgi:hypothetical protein
MPAAKAAVLRPAELGFRPFQTEANRIEPSAPYRPYLDSEFRGHGGSIASKNAEQSIFVEESPPIPTASSRASSRRIARAEVPTDSDRDDSELESLRNATPVEAAAARAAPDQSAPAIPSFRDTLLPNLGRELWNNAFDAKEVIDKLVVMATDWLSRIKDHFFVSEHRKKLNEFIDLYDDRAAKLGEDLREIQDIALQLVECDANVACINALHQESILLQIQCVNDYRLLDAVVKPFLTPYEVPENVERDKSPSSEIDESLLLEADDTASNSKGKKGSGKRTRLRSTPCPSSSTKAPPTTAAKEKGKTKAKAASLHQDSDGSADFEKTLTDEGVPTKKKRGRPRTEKTTSETSPLSRKRPNI